MLENMGIMAPVARLLAREHLREPITGKILVVGRQSVPLTATQAVELLATEGIEARDYEIEIDKDTRASHGHGYITD